jgi:sugar lactone lactonase YvrE
LAADHDTLGVRENIIENRHQEIMSRIHLQVALAILGQSLSFSQNQSIITTVAGTGRVLSGLGGLAIGLRMANPTGLAIDSKGNVYVADNTADVVFKISPGGVASVFAGNGSVGFSGDGGAGASATFTNPSYVAVDATDNIYIADFHNERVRKVDGHGIITTVVGGGAAFGTNEIPAVAAQIFEPNGLAFDRSGNLYLSTTTGGIQEVTTDGIIHHVVGGSTGFGFSGDGGLASTAQISNVAGLATDGKGNLYFVDNQRIRKIDSNGIISTVAGNGIAGFAGDGGPAISASFSFPSGIALDAAGNLYVADTYNHCIRRVASDGTVKTVAGNPNFSSLTPSGDGGPATSASLALPYGVAIDAAGNLYISDKGQRRIRKVSAAGIMTTSAGDGSANFAGDGGQATQAAFDFPADVKLDDAGNLYIADAYGHRVRRIAPNGIVTTIAGNGTPGFSGDGGLATKAQLNTPVAVAVDGKGNVYVSDQNNVRVRKVTPDGVITTYAGGGNGPFGSGDGGTALAASFYAGGISLDPAGNLYVADSGGNRIRKISPNGVITTVAGNGTQGYSGDGGPAPNAMLSNPVNVVADKAGNIYIAENGNRVIRKVNQAALISTVAGNGTMPAPVVEGQPATSQYLDYPQSLAADDEGNLYLNASWYIFRINPNGIMTILAGAGLEAYQEGFDGDGGPSIAAHIRHDNNPLNVSMGMVIDGAGNLYFADTGNDRIRKITNANAPVQLAISNPKLQPVLSGADVLDFYLTGSDSVSLGITNVGAGSMSWTASVSTLDGGTWLQISTGSGNAPSSLVASSIATDLSPGLYRGTVLLSALGATNSPRYVSGLLTIPIFAGAGASSGPLVVSEPAGVSWFVSSNVDWLKITSASSGSGTDTISYSIDPNPRTAVRTATLTVGGAPVFVSQAAGPAPLRRWQPIHRGDP